MNGVNKKAVVITGASSGIGRASAARMVQSAWRVFTLVRNMEDGHRLRSDFGKNLTPVIMDATDRASVIAAAEQVSSQLNGNGLHGLVNVAGIGKVRPIEYMTPNGLLEIFDINVFGQIAFKQRSRKSFAPIVILNRQNHRSQKFWIVLEGSR